MRKKVNMKLQELVNLNMIMTVTMKQTAIVMDMMTVTSNSIGGNGIIFRGGNGCE
jgi:hypothetical protein